MNYHNNFPPADEICAGKTCWTTFIFKHIAGFTTVLKQIKLKIPVFDLNNCFVCHWTSAVDVQSIIKLLQLIHNLLTSGNKVRSSVSIFLVVSNRDVSSLPNG